MSRTKERYGALSHTHGAAAGAEARTFYLLRLQLGLGAQGVRQVRVHVVNELLQRRRLQVEAARDVLPEHA